MQYVKSHQNFNSLTVYGWTHWLTMSGRKSWTRNKQFTCVLDLLYAANLSAWSSPRQWMV